MPMLLVSEFLASTSKMWHLGQIAETMSRSSEISPAQPAFALGSGPFLPFWLTMRRHPLAFVHFGSPNMCRYWARSAPAFGSLNASTIAMVLPLPRLGDALVSL